jgi:hypothetical protein
VSTPLRGIGGVFRAGASVTVACMSITNLLRVCVLTNFPHLSGAE